MKFSHQRIAGAMLAAVWSVAAVATPLSDEDELALVYGDKASVRITPPPVPMLVNEFTNDLPLAGRSLYLQAGIEL